MAYGDIHEKSEDVMADTVTLEQAAIQTHSVDMSMIGLFLAADPVVKFVMFLLVAASVWGWAIIFSKTGTLA